MTEERYRAAAGINKSTLWEMRKSPAHYQYILQHPPADSPAFAFGRALHAAVLTPRIFKRDFFTAPSLDRRTKAGKEEYAAWIAGLPEGAEILTAEDAETIRAMSSRIRAAAGDLLKCTQREKAIFWHDSVTGLKCKARLDVLGPEWIADLKTTSDMLSFRRDAIKYGYHVQAAHYQAGVAAKTGRVLPWYFIVCEKVPPYGVQVLQADITFLDAGEWLRGELLEKVKACQDAREWPSYSRSVIKWGGEA